MPGYIYIDNYNGKQSRKQVWGYYKNMVKEARNSNGRNNKSKKACVNTKIKKTNHYVK